MNKRFIPILSALLIASSSYAMDNNPVRPGDEIYVANLLQPESHYNPDLILEVATTNNMSLSQLENMFGRESMGRFIQENRNNPLIPERLLEEKEEQELSFLISQQRTEFSQFRNENINNFRSKEDEERELKTIGDLSLEIYEEEMDEYEEKENTKQIQQEIQKLNKKNEPEAEKIKAIIKEMKRKKSFSVGLNDIMTALKVQYTDEKLLEKAQTVITMALMEKDQNFTTIEESFMRTTLDDRTINRTIKDILQ